MNPHIYMFPGQGSQKTGMGERLFKKFPGETKQASEVAGFNIKEVCINAEKKSQLNNTQFTQPALYFVNALHYMEKKKANEISETPVFIGHSLGEYNALHAAGALQLFDGLKAVTERGTLMASAGVKNPGAMAAVLGLSGEEVKKICETTAKQKNSSKENIVYIANINTTGQIVISGTADAIANNQQTFLDAGAKRYIPLNVSGAFHSPLMQEVANQFLEVLNKIPFSIPLHKVYSNVSAKPHETEIKEIKEAMVKQLCNSVRWHETLLNIKNTYNAQNENFSELGPGNVLTGLLRKA